jgi:hypothetical protein
LAGFVPLLEAEQRLAVSRRALDGIEGLITALHRAAATEAAEDLDFIRADPVAAVYAYEAEEALGEQVLAVRDELPLMLFGVLIAYQLSLLESCLAGCVETAAAVRGERPPTRMANPKLESLVKALESLGVVVEWGEDLWRELRGWRSRRNAIMHRLDTAADGVLTETEAEEKEDDSRRTLTATALGSLVDVIEEAIKEVDLAMSRIANP